MMKENMTMADPPQPRRRVPQPWPEWVTPVLLPVSGFRDQTHRITYFPWSNPTKGYIGWEVIPDAEYKNVLFYLVPNVRDEVMEIRCHFTADEPDPELDRLLGVIAFPAGMLDPQD
jgi:hypothetical protein